jgi:hypothetical protein
MPVVRSARTMKVSIALLSAVLSVLFAAGQNKECCTTYVYEGNIFIGVGQKMDLKLNVLILLDSTMVGSCRYDAGTDPIKLTGKLRSDLTFYLSEQDKADSTTGFFNGRMEPGFTSAAGKWRSGSNPTTFDFQVRQVVGKSFWDYIKKNRAFYEYTSIKKAIRNKRNVQRINVKNQGLTHLPNELSSLNKVVSINLLGNRLREFPTVLSQLTTLDEISLSSNELTSVGPEIGKLKELRILILNFNQLTELPTEIGELKNLLYLDITSNKLTRLPDEIRYLTNLQELKLWRNNFSDAEKERIKKLLPNCVIEF